MTDLKVLLVGDYPPPSGGIAIHVQQLQRSFSAGGVVARVLDIGKGARDKAPDVLAARGAMELSSQLSRHESWTVHLHTSGNNVRSFLAAAVVRVGARSPAVVTLHSGLLPVFLKSFTHRRALARAALSGYATVIAVSSASRDALLELGLEPERVLVHPAFCSSQVVGGVPTPIVEHALRRRTPLVAYAHHPSPVYGRTLLFDALARLRARHPYVGLAVVGQGTNDESFWRDARRAGVDGIIENLGELPHDQALALFERASVFVRPTFADGDAISVREALTLGTPVVASDACERPKGAVIFRNNDPVDLAEKLSEALVGPRLVHKGPDAGAFLLGLYRSLGSEVRVRQPYRESEGRI